MAEQERPKDLDACAASTRMWIESAIPYARWAKVLEGRAAEALAHHHRGDDFEPDTTTRILRGERRWLSR